MRLILALLVAVNHVWSAVHNMLGYHAVACFYVISGYLMTKVIHEVYGTDPAGVARFLLNRALRVLPPYWMFMGLTAVLLVMLPPEVSWGGVVRLPETTTAWLVNLTLIDLAWLQGGTLVPAAWSLGVELLFYIAMPLLLARSRALVDLWLAASLAITIVLVSTGLPFGHRYYPAYAASLFFALGAFCHTRATLLRRLALPRALLWPAIGLLVVLPIVSEAVDLSHLTWGYYGAALLMVTILATLVSAPKSGPLTSKLDRWLGDLAYPVFLSHFIAAGLLVVALDGRLVVGGAAFTLAMLAVTLTISVAFLLLADPPLQMLRDWIRARGPVTGVAAQAREPRVPRTGR